MNSILSFMNSFLVAVICLSVLGYQKAGAAVCTENNRLCVKTDNTEATCDTSLVCGCKDERLPIPTGCAGKLNSPTVLPDAGRIKQCVRGKQLNLTCSTKETGTLVFVWKKDEITLPTENKPELKIPCDGTEVGKYSCSVNDTSSGLYSDPSAEISIDPYDGTKAVTPLLKVSPAAAGAGAQLDVQCTDIPYGFSYKFKLDSSVDLVDKVVQNSTQKNITCVLDEPSQSGTSIQSLPVPMSTVITEIKTTTISPSTQVTIKAGQSVTFTCVTDPEARFMDSPTAVITYSFKDSGNPSPISVGNKYIFTSSAADTSDRTVSCNATYKGKEIKSPTAVTVSFKDDYLKAPTINASSTIVDPGDRLSVVCTVADVSAKISWLKDGETIPRETDHTIQFGNFQPKDAGTFVCTATKDYFSVNSPELVVRSNAPELRVLSSAVTVLVAILGWKLF